MVVIRAAPEGAQRSVDQARPRVLMAEDEPLLRALMIEILSEVAFQITVAQDGGEAATLLNGGLVVDLLVTNVLMPTLSGWEVARLAREHLPFVGVVYVTGYMGATPEEGVSGSFLLKKPFLPSDLLAAVSQTMGRSGKPHVSS